MQRNLYFLKTNYVNVTCNMVNEIFHKTNVVWQFQYFGLQGLHRNLRWMSATGLLLLYDNLFKFVGDRNVRKLPFPKPKDTGALENLVIAFQLYLLFGGIAISFYLLEIAVFKINLHLQKILNLWFKMRSIFRTVGTGIICVLLTVKNTYTTVIQNLINFKSRVISTFNWMVYTFKNYH